jgi:hypothetical protein
VYQRKSDYGLRGNASTSSMNRSEAEGPLERIDIKNVTPLALQFPDARKARAFANFPYTRL